MSPDRLDAERLGQQLRDAREARELLLEDVEQALRIRARFLAAFESGDYTDLPGLVQARGFLRNYARYLSLDEEACLSQFDAIQAGGGGPTGLRRPQRGPVSVAGVPDPLATSEMGLAGGGFRRRSPLRIVLAAIFVLVIVAGLCAGTIVVLEQALNDQANQEGLNLLSILPTAPTLTPSSTFNPTMTPLPGQAVAAGPLITDRVVLNLNVLQRTFLRVTADGTLLFEGVVTPGTNLPYQADQEIILEASNAAGVDVIFNNLPIGLLGTRGEAITRTFTPDLILTPTVPPLPSTTPTALPGQTSGAGEGATGAEPVTGSESGSGGPTALPIPGVPTQTPADGELSSGAQPSVDLSGGQPPQENPTLELLPTLTPLPTDTPQPTNTVAPSPTVTPTPTAILPPRQTATPIPQKPA